LPSTVIISEESAKCISAESDAFQIDLIQAGSRSDEFNLFNSKNYFSPRQRINIQRTRVSESTY